MSHAITARLDKDLGVWLEETTARTGVSQGQILRLQLEKARADRSSRPFTPLAGVLRGLPNDLSARKGFSNE